MDQPQGFQLKNYSPFSSRQSIREYPCRESCVGKIWTGWPNRTFPSLIWFSEFHAFWQYYKVRQAFLFRRGIKVSKNQHQLTNLNNLCQRDQHVALELHIVLKQLKSAPIHHRVSSVAVPESGCSGTGVWQWVTKQLLRCSVTIQPSCAPILLFLKLPSFSVL